MSDEPRVEVIPLDAIRVPERRRRRVDPAAVERLAESMRVNGLLSPITVRGDGRRGYLLIAGAHRLAAGRLLKLVDIPAIVRDVDDLQAAIIEIDENLIRAELTALERAEHLADREHLHAERGDAMKRGGDRKSDAFRSNGHGGRLIAPFSEDAAAQTGIAVRTIRRDVQIGKGLVSEVRDELRETKTAESTTALAALSVLPPSVQRTVVATTDLNSPSDVRKAAKAATREKRPKRRARPATRPRVVETRRPPLVERFLYTLGAMHYLLGVDPREVAPLLNDDEATHYRSLAPEVRRWLDLIDDGISGR